LKRRGSFGLCAEKQPEMTLENFVTRASGDLTMGEGAVREGRWTGDESNLKKNGRSDAGGKRRTRVEADIWSTTDKGNRGKKTSSGEKGGKLGKWGSDIS